MSAGAAPGEAAIRPGAPERRAERALARRSRTRHGRRIAAISTILVFGTLIALIVTSPGWEDVKQTFFSWDVFKQSFPDVLAAFWLDVRVFVVVEIAVLALGLLVALLRVVTGPALFPLRMLAVAYTDVFRGIPTILLVYLFGFGIPALQLEGLKNVDVIVFGSIALALSYGAYVAEVYRAGLNSVHRSQREAALAVGLSESQALRHVVLPQAVRRVGPPLLNDFIALQKDVALLSILGPLLAFREAQIFASRDFNYTPLVAAAIIYLCITIPLARLLDRWDRGLGGKAQV